MAVNERVMPVPRDAVWSVLSDGWSYVDWVVGTSEIRDVDGGFPRKGTSLHYRVGYGPLRHEGHTEVLEARPAERLVLEANAWPAGTIKITIELTDARAGCCVRISERPARGLASVLHNPVQDAVLRLRNVECLRRLERLAVERQAGRPVSGAQR